MLTFAARLPRAERAGQAAIDRLAADAVDAAGSPIDPAAIRAAIEAARDEDDLVERLGQLAAELPATQFREVVDRALFAADLIGYESAARG